VRLHSIYDGSSDLGRAAFCGLLPLSSCRETRTEVR
jgi:hypothetical protein